MYTILLGMLLSSGAQAPSWYYPGYGCACYCGGVYAMPVAPPVAVVAGKSHLEKQVQNLRRRMKSMEEKFDKMEPQVKLTRDALLELAKRVEKIDDEVDDLDDDVEEIEETIKKKGGMIDSKLEELADRLKKVERQQKKEKAAKKQAEIDDLKKRLEKLEDARPQPAPPPPAPPATSAVDAFIERLKQVELRVQMADDGKQDAILERLSKVESNQTVTDQKLQSTIDALRALSENVGKGFLELNSRVRSLEESRKPMPPASSTLPTPPPPQGAGSPEDTFGRNQDTAMVIVSLPAEAKLYLNGKVTRSTGALRSYVTPKLAPGQNYSYAVRAEVSVNGETVSETRQVNFQAGRQVNLSFDGLGKSALDRLRMVRFE